VLESPWQHLEQPLLEHLTSHSREPGSPRKVDLEASIKVETFEECDLADL
jgi:hypothetical protein